jgi:UDP-glucose 4-epimerase
VVLWHTDRKDKIKLAKILVTGGAGFIASHIVDAYINNGDKVVVIDNLSTGKRENVNLKAKFYHLDISDSYVADIFAEEKFDLISHHAAQVSVRNSVADPVFDAQTNILGSIKLMELAVKHKVKKFVFASTGGVIYGEQDYYPADENHPLRPVSPYGVAKLAAEKYLWFYHCNSNLDYVVLRYGNVYGPRQDPFGEAGVVAIFAQQMLNCQQPVINGTGEQTRDFVYVGDVVRANLLVQKLSSCEIINIGTGRETSVNSLFDQMVQITNTGFKRVYGPPKKGEQQRSVLSYERAKRLLSWQPEISLGEGLEMTIDYFRKLKERDKKQETGDGKLS